MIWHIQPRPARPSGDPAAFENLRLYASLHGIWGAEAFARISELLELVGLADVGEKQVGLFSSGMKQRLLIARALVSRLATLPETEEVGGGVEWMDRFAHGQRLLWLVALGVGAVLAGAAILTVATATALVLHARRDEMEIMRLVGAPEHVVRLQLLLQGMMQGLIGAVLAIWVLIGGYAIIGPHIEPLVTETLGVTHLAFLQPLNVLSLMAAGTLLGGLGGWLAWGRP